jgi:hypothetical protein
MLDPLGNGLFQLPRIVIILKLDHVFHGTVIAFDLALGLRVIWGAMGVLDVLILKLGLQLATDVTGVPAPGPIVG